MHCPLGQGEEGAGDFPTNGAQITEALFWLESLNLLCNVFTLIGNNYSSLKQGCIRTAYSVV